MKFSTFSPFKGEGLATKQSKRFYFYRAHCLTISNTNFSGKINYPPPSHFALSLSRRDSCFLLPAVLRINCYKTLGSAGNRNF
jgi:hypothetical protein